MKRYKCNVVCRNCDGEIMKPCAVEVDDGSAPEVCPYTYWSDYEHPSWIEDAPLTGGAPKTNAQQLKAAIALLKDGVINDDHDDLREGIVILETFATAAV